MWRGSKGRGKKGRGQKDEGPDGEKKNRTGNILFDPVPNACLGPVCFAFTMTGNISISLFIFKD